MPATIWLIAATFVGALYALLPLLVRKVFRFAAQCRPTEMKLEELPEQVAALFQAKVPDMRSLGFELVGFYDCGALTLETRSYIAYFCNRRTNEFANVSVLISARKPASYLEFSTRLANGLMLETNTNRVLPLSPADGQFKVFRLPQVQQPQALLAVHRLLVEKYAGGMFAQGEPQGKEIQRFVRVVENYGPRHARMGYMCPTPDGQFYQLTWKGAFLMTWRGMWPSSLLRRMIERHAMHSELDSLQSRGVAVLQKA